MSLFALTHRCYSKTPKADYKNSLVKGSDFGNAEVLLAEQARFSGPGYCADARG